MSAPKSKGKKKRITRRNLSAWILTGLLIGLMLLRLIAGFFRSSPTANANQPQATATPAALTELDRAQSALETYFKLLHDGRYSEAVTYYGGSYDVLEGYNPPDVGHPATLLEDACTKNGFQCLPVKRVVDARQAGSDAFNFAVEFARSDGSLLMQPDGDPPSGAATPYTFPFTVVKVDGSFLVQELPVYLP